MWLFWGQVCESAIKAIRRTKPIYVQRRYKVRNKQFKGSYVLGIHISHFAVIVYIEYTSIFLPVYLYSLLSQVIQIYPVSLIVDLKLLS